MKTTSILTTGQVAQICEVAPRTVSKWFDSGRLRGYRIPGSQDRRIPRENLVRFMREHGMPLDRVVKDDLDRVLIIGREECQIISSLAGCGLTVETAQSGFEGGMRVGANCPDCAIIDAESAGDFGAMDIAHVFRCMESGPCATVLIALLPPGSNSNIDHSMFDETFRRPFDPALLAMRVRSLIDRKKS